MICGPRRTLDNWKYDALYCCLQEFCCNLSSGKIKSIEMDRRTKDADELRHTLSMRTSVNACSNQYNVVLVQVTEL
jgi:hypothetical protein